MEGILRVKKDSGGYRHYIELESGEHEDISCGHGLEVQLGVCVPDGESEKMVPAAWISGRYEAHLMEIPEAYLYFGYSYPAGYPLKFIIPLGSRVRKPRRGK